MSVDSRKLFVKDLEEDFVNSNPDFKILYDFLLNGPIGTVNVKIGDRVTTDKTSALNSRKIEAIDGSLVTLDDSTVIDLSKEDLYKLEDQPIACVKPINIKYGK